MYFQKFRVQKPEGDFIIAPSITDKNLYICSSVLPNLQLPPTFDRVGPTTTKHTSSLMSTVPYYPVYTRACFTQQQRERWIVSFMLKFWTDSDFIQKAHSALWLILMQNKESNHIYDFN